MLYRVSPKQNMIYSLSAFFLKMTKCGRFGANSFDYSPVAIRNSVLQSLRRLQTEYLDTVYLHDVEFVCTPVQAKQTGNHALALTEEKAAYGLEEGQEGIIHGEGDQKILDAFAELRKMKEEGLIRSIGITGMFSSSFRISIFMTFVFKVTL